MHLTLINTFELLREAVVTAVEEKYSTSSNEKICVECYGNFAGNICMQRLHRSVIQPKHLEKRKGEKIFTEKFP